MFVKSTFLMALALVAVSAFAQTSPKDVVKDIESIQQKTYADARATGKAPDFTAMHAQMKEKAEAALKGMDWSKIDAKDAYDWAKVCSYAEEHKTVCDLTHKYLAANPTAPDKFDAEMLMMSSCNALGESSMLEGELKSVSPSTSDQSIQLAEETVYEFTDTIVKGKGAKDGVKVLESVASKMTYVDPPVKAKEMLPNQKEQLAKAGKNVPSDDELLKTLTTRYQGQNDSIRLMFVDKETELLNQEGKTKQAVAKVDDFIKEIGPTSPIVKSANMLRTRLTLKGSPAPEITFDKQYGTFTNLASLKGKVVVVDTFAHWCGPCKASFPEMRKMYDDLKPKGLEVVGVTEYYGFMGQDRGLTPDAEYAKMADFRTQYNMDWPIVFGPKSNFENYGISGIPTAYVIDRSGKIRDIHVGYSPESFKEFRTEVEKLVDEK
jgi:peroxiredoxin